MLQQEDQLLRVFRAMDWLDRAQYLAMGERLAADAINRRPDLRLVVGGTDPTGDLPLVSNTR